MHGDGFGVGRRRGGNRYGASGRINSSDQAARAVFLPIFALVGLLLRDVHLFHGDDRSGEERFAVSGHFSANEKAVAELNILELERRGVLQILLPRFNAKEAGALLNEDGDIGAGIAGDGDGGIGDGLHGAEKSCRLRAGRLRFLRR